MEYFNLYINGNCPQRPLFQIDIHEINCSAIKQNWPRYFYRSASIKPRKIDVVYLFVLGGIHFVFVSTIILLDFGTVPAVWYCLFFVYSQYFLSVICNWTILDLSNIHYTKLVLGILDQGAMCGAGTSYPYGAPGFIPQSSV
jgi:hypothetical protein